MKKIKNYCMCVAVAILCMAMVWVGGCNSAIRTYDGRALPLEEVAVISITQETCPITRFDGELVDLKYRTGIEYHLLPGKHTIQVVGRKKTVYGHWRNELVDLDYDFKAGYMYSIPKTNQPVDQENLMNIEWSPYVAEQGEMVAFAAQNPDYFKHSSAWKKLRKENGLTPSFFDKIKLANWFKPKSTKVAEQQSVKKF